MMKHEHKNIIRHRLTIEMLNMMVCYIVYIYNIVLDAFRELRSLPQELVYM